MTAATEEVVFRAVEGIELTAYLVRPEGPPALAPALILLHGGSWRSGHPFSFLPHCHYFARRGIAAASVSYRLIGRGTDDLRDCIADAQAATRWMRGLGGIDSTRIAVGGHSAGGHLAACTALLPELEPSEISCRPDAMLLLNPVTQVVSRETQAVIDALSPCSHVSGPAPPTLLAYGRRDFLRPLILRFGDALSAAGTRVDLAELDGAHTVVHPPARRRDKYIAALRPLDEFLVSLGYLGPGDVPEHVDGLDLHEILGGRSESVDPRKTRPRRRRPPPS